MKASVRISGMIARDGEKLPSDAGERLKQVSLFSLTDLNNQLEQAGKFDELEVHISSIGGNVVEGFKIYDALKKLDAKIITIGEQFDSIASVIFLAGDERKAYKNAKPLIHSPWATAESLGDMKINSTILEAIAEQYRLADSQMLAVYSEVCGRDKAPLFNELMKGESHMSDEDLINTNFATEIIEGAQMDAIRMSAVAFHPEALLAAQRNEYSDVIGVTTSGKCLLVKRSESSEIEPNKWAFAGGKIEEGETPEQAAARELKEEVGITASSLEYIESVENDDGSVSHYFAAIIKGQITSQQDEVSETKLVSSLEGLEIIFGQDDRYISLIQKSVEKMTKSSELKEGYNALQKIVNGLKGLFAMEDEKKAASFVVPEAGITVYVDDSDGEVIGKVAYIMEGDVVTEQTAPVGSHVTESGATLVIGEGGVLSEVREPEAMKENEASYDEETQAKIDEAVAEKEKEMQALKTKLEAMEASNKELKAAMTKKVDAFEKQANKLSEAINSLVGTAHAEGGKKEPVKEDKELTPYEKLAARAVANIQ